MIRNTVSVTAVVTLLGFGMTPLFASQMPGMQMPATSQMDNSKNSLDAEMMDHQKEMQTLLAKLDESFKAITDARDEKGYVRDKAVFKAHEANMKALQDAARDHELFLGDYEHQCGGAAGDGMIFVTDACQAVPIRNGERGDAAFVSKA